MTVFSCTVGIRKPDPRLYRIAITKLRVEADRCLYVGDGGHDELGGAARAGMTAILLQTDPEPNSPKATGCASKVNAIPEVLDLL